jgi:hypothetical protein
MSTASRELLAANAAYYSAFEAADPLAMDDVWSGGEDDVCVHPGWDVCSGSVNVRNSYRRIFSTGERLRVQLGGVRVDIHGDIGRVTAVEHVYAPEVRAMVGRVACTNLFLRVEGAWKMILHHGSPIHTAVEEGAGLEDDGDFN